MGKNKERKNKEKDHKARKRGQRLPRSVKQLIGYDSMLRNGIAYLGDDRWSATILFQDINYQLSQKEHQMEIIDRWAKLINSFDAGQSLQIAAYTRTAAWTRSSGTSPWPTTATGSTRTGETTTPSSPANSNQPAATPRRSRR